MEISRRTVLRSGLAAGAVSALGLPQLNAPVFAAAPPAAPAGTTLERTYQVASRVGRPGGYAPILVGAGEPTMVRSDFTVPIDGREGRRNTLIAFAQLSDVHIVDAQSPMRVEYLDRFEDEDVDGDFALGLLDSSYRPQEMISAHVAEAMVRQINSVGVGPVTGTPLALAIQTGDNSDNAQFNEVRWNIDLMDGGTNVVQDSGNLFKWEGVHDTYGWTYDTHYWHPDGRPGILRPFDQARTKYGFPLIPGLLNAVRKPFMSQGLNMEWYTAFGNHDGLVQGNFPPGSLGLALNAVAQGRLKLVSPPPGMSQADLYSAIRGNYKGLLESLSPAYVRVVSPDPKRRILRRGDVVAEHFKTTGGPVGHGFTAQNVANKTAYYFFDKGNVRFVALDTVDPNGYADGSIDQPQMNWLTALLAASTGKYVVIFSHHTSETMGNPLIATGIDLNPRVLGPAVVNLLLSYPNVIAWVNGHSHVNKIWARSAAGKPGRFWEINTASHCDFPAQTRLIEIADNVDGTISIYTTMLDHAGPAAYGGVTNNPVSLAGLARELGANDWQSRTRNRSGTPADRNVELLIQKPALV